MRLIALMLLCCLVILPAHAQQNAAIDVFLAVDSANQTATLYFTNPVSGLSTPVTISPLPRNTLPAQGVRLTRDGVLFDNPESPKVMLARPNGRVEPLTFIPQNGDGLVALDWVVSDDGGSIAWVEVYPSQNNWLSNVFVASLDGSDIQAIAAPPISTLDPFSRITPLAISNDRSRLLYDAAGRVEGRNLTAYFSSYRDVQLYDIATGATTPLEREPLCDCAVGVGDDLNLVLRLDGSGDNFGAIWQDFGADFSQDVDPIDTPFAQAGDIFIPDGFPVAFYTQASNQLDDSLSAQFALVMVNLATNTQEILIPPSPQRFVIAALIDGGTTLLMHDVYGGATYKLSWITGELALVSERTWLGQISG